MKKEIKKTDKKDELEALKKELAELKEKVAKLEAEQKKEIHEYHYYYHYLTPMHPQILPIPTWNPDWTVWGNDTRSTTGTTLTSSKDNNYILSGKKPNNE